jgi:hypothetical protein
VFPLLLGAAACADLLGDLDRIVAIEVVGSAAVSLEEGDTLTLVARALTASGAEASEAVITWGLVDPDTAAIGLTVDPATGYLAAIRPSVDSLIAQAEGLTAGPVVVRVVPAPDSAAAEGVTRVVADSTVAASPPLGIVVFDLTTQPGAVTPLSGIEVEFEVIQPAPGDPLAPPLFVTAGDTVPGDPPHRVAVTSGANGRATAYLRRAGAAFPDSAVVDATVRRADGGAVLGSPVRFVVVYRDGS